MQTIHMRTLRKGVSLTASRRGKMAPPDAYDLTDMREALCGAPQSIARMGYGAATGEGRAIAAARRAISCPLMKDIDFHAAQAFLILVSGNSDMLLDEYDQAVSCIQDMAQEDAIIICGMTCDEKMG